MKFVLKNFETSFEKLIHELTNYYHLVFFNRIEFANNERKFWAIMT
jgi:hypothetical protein